jgi:hypothetical protein
MEDGQPLGCIAALYAGPPSSIPTAAPRKRVAEAAREYIERSKQKSRRTYLGYRVAVNLFVASCKKTYFDQICRDDMLDFLHDLRTRPSRETGQPMGESTVFNYFLKTMVFVNDRGIGKYVGKEDWVQKKDWPVNVDKRNKNKKYATYTEQEVAAMGRNAARGTRHSPARPRSRKWHTTRARNCRRSAGKKRRLLLTSICSLIFEARFTTSATTHALEIVWTQTATTLHNIWPENF